MALRPKPSTTPLARALDLGMQFTFAVVIGVVLGYYLDRWLGTEPVFLLILTGLGVAAAIRSLLRFARRNTPKA